MANIYVNILGKLKQLLNTDDIIYHIYRYSIQYQQDQNFQHLF